MLTKFKITHEILRAFSDMRLFNTMVEGEQRFALNQEIQVDTAAVIEPYAAFCNGHTLFSCGAFTYSYSPLDAQQRVGRYCSIATGVKNFSVKHPLEFVSTSHFNGLGAPIYRQAFLDRQKEGPVPFNTLPYDPGRYLPAEIGHDVWVGEGAVLARNIRIGTGAVIGANAVVTRDVPPYAIVAGVPAKVVRYRFPEPLVAQLLATEWWRYRFTDFGQLHYAEPERFVGEFQDALAAGRLQPFDTGTQPFVERLAERLTQYGAQPPVTLTDAIRKASHRAELDASFPAPPDCNAWYPAERDARDGGVMRFFAHRAWLDLPVDADGSHLELLVHHCVHRDAIGQLELRLGGVPLRRCEHVRDALGRDRLRFELPAEPAHTGPVARLELRCDATFRPSLLRAGSTDQRMLSLAIGPPGWVRQQQPVVIDATALTT